MSICYLRSYARNYHHHSDWDSQATASSTLTKLLKLCWKLISHNNAIEFYFISLLFGPQKWWCGSVKRESKKKIHHKFVSKCQTHKRLFLISNVPNSSASFNLHTSHATRYKLKSRCVCVCLDLIYESSSTSIILVLVCLPSCLDNLFNCNLISDSKMKSIEGTNIVSSRHYGEWLNAFCGAVCGGRLIFQHGRDPRVSVWLVLPYVCVQLHFFTFNSVRLRVDRECTTSHCHSSHHSHTCFTEFFESVKIFIYHNLQPSAVVVERGQKIWRIFTCIQLVCACIRPFRLDLFDFLCSCNSTCIRVSR